MAISSLGFVELVSQMEGKIVKGGNIFSSAFVILEGSYVPRYHQRCCCNFLELTIWRTACVVFIVVGSEYAFIGCQHTVLHDHVLNLSFLLFSC